MYYSGVINPWEGQRRSRASGAPGSDVTGRTSAPHKTAAQAGEKAGWLRNRGLSEGAPRAPPVSPTAVHASEEFLGQRDDDARRASHVAEPVLVLVLGHLADEFGAVGAQASDGVVDAFDCEHDAPEAQRVRRCDRWFDLDQFRIAKLRQLEPPAPIWGPHHNDVRLGHFRARCTRSTHGPSTGISPSSAMPRAVKEAIARAGGPIGRGGQLEQARLGDDRASEALRPTRFPFPAALSRSSDPQFHAGSVRARRQHHADPASLTRLGRRDSRGTRGRSSDER